MHRDRREDERMAYLTCSNLSLGYDAKAIVENVNFQVNADDYLCIVGENGSGKSTLMKTLLGLQSPVAGEIRLGDGLQPNEIGYLPQQTVVQKDFPASVREIVLSGCLARLGRRPFYTKEMKRLAEENMAASGSRSCRGAATGSSPAVSSRESCWPERSAPPGRSCFWTSRYPAWTRRLRRRCTSS